MSIAHRMTGYDKRTESLQIEHDIPNDRLGEVRVLAHVPSEDEDAVGSYPLNGTDARQVGWKLGKDINPDLYNWFVEPFAD
jgi:hypothetical protein